MKRIILFSIILSFIFVLVGCNSPRLIEWNTEILQYRVGDGFNIGDMTELSYRISYENEYTVTYIFVHPHKWIWVYITVDKSDGKIKLIRSTYDKP